MTIGQRHALRKMATRGILKYRSGLFMPGHFHPTIIGSCIRNGWAVVISFRGKSSKPGSVYITTIGRNALEVL